LVEDFLMNIRNLIFTVDGCIDCEIEHPVYGWIPFTASPDDVEETGRNIYAQALLLNPAPYVPPPEPPLPPPSPAELIDTYRRAVQAHVDATAQSKGYNDAATLAGYTNSTVPPWKAEAEVFVAWRDQVWLSVFELLAQIQSGDVEPPESPAALIGWLPQIEWP
jgi:hypothetical protein